MRETQGHKSCTKVVIDNCKMHARKRLREGDVHCMLDIATTYCLACTGHISITIPDPKMLSLVVLMVCPFFSMQEASSRAQPIAAAADATRQVAIALKDSGNTLFQAGKVEEAVKLYTQSIQAAPTVAAHANRSAAHLKLCNWQEAESDATAAIRLEPGHVKVPLTKKGRMKGRRDGLDGTTL